jgi:hypothetical protein
MLKLEIDLYFDKTIIMFKCSENIIKKIKSCFKNAIQFIKLMFPFKFKPEMYFDINYTLYQNAVF